MSKLTTEAVKQPLGLPAFLTLRLMRGLGLGEKDLVFRVKASAPYTEWMWREASALSDAYTTLAMPDFCNSSLAKNTVKSGYEVNDTLQKLSKLACLGLCYSPDAIKRDVPDLIKETEKDNPDSPHGLVVYRTLKEILSITRDVVFVPSEIRKFPTGDNPLYPTIRKLCFHTPESRSATDLVDRSVPLLWSARHQPNCLGNAVSMVGLLRHTGLRFYLASGLRLISTDTRQGRIETLTRIVKLKMRLNMDADRAIEMLDEQLKEEGTFDWMYHQFVIVQCNADTHDWAILDPFMHSSTYMPMSESFTRLANALDARKKAYPGLAVAIDHTHGASEVGLRRLRRRLTHGEHHVENLYAAYITLPREKRPSLTLSEFESLCTGTSAAASLAWLLKRFRRNKYEDRNLLESLMASDEQWKLLVSKEDETRQALTLEQQMELVPMHLKMPAIEWLISSVAVNLSMVHASIVHEDFLEILGHPSFEVYADHDHALGLLLSNAYVASTGLRALSPKLLRVSSSQLIWNETAEKQVESEDVLVSLARRAADSSIGKLPENRLHPLVSRRRRLLKVASTTKSYGTVG